jgi:hypothetical protein
MAARVMDDDPPLRRGNESDVEPTASQVLRSFAARTEKSVSLGELMAATGSRVHGLALLLLVLPETLPLPLPSISPILAVPLFLISLHLMVFGEGSLWPSRLDAIRIRRSAVAATVRYVAPILEWLESMSRPRWSILVRHERLIGLACVYLSLVLFLPVPFVNAPPAICLALIAFGLVQRDGVIISLGIAGTAVITAAVVWIAFWAGGLVTGAG